MLVSNESRYLGVKFMLLEFMVENYMSFKEPNTFSLIATSDNEMFEEQTINFGKKHRALRNAAIFGPNASGKSNLLHAITFVKDFVINSSKDSQQGDPIDSNPFKFSTVTENLPSVFELVFVVNGIVYRYGFGVNEKEVVAEWLFARFTTRETELFARHYQKINVGLKFSEGRKHIDFVRNNALFLSVCAQFNGKISKSVLEWFRKLNVISSLNSDYVPTTLKILENQDNEYEVQKHQLINLIKSVDMGIEDLSIHEQEVDFDSLFDNIRFRDLKNILEISKETEEGNDGSKLKAKFTSHVVKTVHSKYDHKKDFVSQDLYNFGIESSGTHKLFELAGPIIDTMYSGGVLFIDEIQNSLHTKLVSGLIKFIIKTNEKSNAQFVFTTHDTNILTKNLLRRDQLWFVSKNKYGESELSCLADFDEHVRKDASIDKDYLRGRYGAIPHITLEG